MFKALLNLQSEKVCRGEKDMFKALPKPSITHVAKIARP